MNAPVIMRKDRIDITGAGWLIGISALLGVNQVLIKLVNAGMSPVFQAGLRSACAIVPILAWAWWRRRKLSVSDGSLTPGLVAGLFFAFEFLLLFLALDLTTVSRSAVLFYTMPVWMALGAHFLIPGESLTPRRIAGLTLAVAGVAVALWKNDQPATPHALAGDLMALAAATGWAGVGLTARVTKLNRSGIEQQLLYQLVVSAPILLLAAPFFGEPFRAMTPFLWSVFSFQVLAIVCAAFLTWFWLLKIYPASDMASYAFLTPLFGVAFGHVVFGDPLSANILAALALVGAGIWLVNRR